MRALLGKLADVVMPAWCKWAAIAALCAAAYGAGRLQEARRGADAMVAYIGRQATQTARVTQAQVKVVTVTETKWRDRIQKIYVQGASIETNIPTYVRPADAELFAVNAGFVRVLDAAWSGDAVGPAAESDREPAGVPIDDIARSEVGNITSCRTWREQALGWRDFYARQQVAINGKAGAWAKERSLPETAQE
jgi:hypothetical protein